MRILTFLFAWLPALAAAMPVVIMEAPVRVLAEVINDTRIENGISNLALTVIDGRQGFRFSVLQQGNAAAAIARQKARIGWRDGHLFIRDECLIEDRDKKPWRCSLDKVFTFAETRAGKQLIYVGDVFSGDDCEGADRSGCAVYQGAFTDIYDLLENNALTSLTEAPALLLEMKLKSGEFSVDLEDTWQRNQERYQAGEKCLAAAPAERMLLCVDGISPRRAYMFNAALAIYTRRDAALDRTRRFARSALCDNVPEEECSATLRAATIILSRIAPGAKPKNRGMVRAFQVNESK